MEREREREKEERKGKKRRRKERGGRKKRGKLTRVVPVAVSQFPHSDLRSSSGSLSKSCSTPASFSVTMSMCPCTQTTSASSPPPDPGRKIRTFPAASSRSSSPDFPPLPFRSSTNARSQRTTASSLLDGRGRAERERKCCQRSGGSRPATAATEEAGGAGAASEEPSAIVLTGGDDGEICEGEGEKDEPVPLCPCFLQGPGERRRRPERVRKERGAERRQRRDRRRRDAQERSIDRPRKKSGRREFHFSRAAPTIQGASVQREREASGEPSPLSISLSRTRLSLDQSAPEPESREEKAPNAAANKARRDLDKTASRRFHSSSAKKRKNEMSLRPSLPRTREALSASQR